ncbi:hypothetical protein TorRG33x02_345730 [Trema orientale]|uniref:Uncharacterized protein n=1 Tax=Trema orientale TaxID=63057 RepID=A0A2P5ANW7_TREOI|nr:hypothetical protein TorRG33x02_345730 [Trema orientale]
MSTTSALNIRLVLRLTKQIQRLKNHNSQHKEMDSENGESFLVQHVNPKAGENEIRQREKEVNPREHSFTGGEVVPDVAPPVEIVHRRSYIHGDLRPRIAIGEEERVLIRIRLVVHRVDVPAG